jgi:argininosuccinate lyase
VQALFMLMKALPMTYNKDMAEDQELLFDSVDTITACLLVMCKVIETFGVNVLATESSVRGGDLIATGMS